MPRLSRTVPRYRKHRASGQALVVLSGQGFYLGPYGTRTSKLEYDRLVAEWLARGRRPREQYNAIPLLGLERIQALLAWELIPPTSFTQQDRQALSDVVEDVRAHSLGYKVQTLR